jgi:hypothetical protein
MLDEKLNRSGRCEVEDAAFRRLKLPKSKPDYRVSALHVLVK